MNKGLFLSQILTDIKLDVFNYRLKGDLGTKKKSSWSQLQSKLQMDSIQHMEGVAMKVKAPSFFGAPGEPPNLVHRPQSIKKKAQLRARKLAKLKAERNERLKEHHRDAKQLAAKAEAMKAAKAKATLAAAKAKSLEAQRRRMALAQRKKSLQRLERQIAAPKASAEAAPKTWKAKAAAKVGAVTAGHAKGKAK